MRHGIDDEAGIKTLIQRDDILSMEYLKKTEFTGCHQGMRYRLEGIADAEGTAIENGGKKLLCTVWPEPFAFSKTPEEKKETAEFPFGEDGVAEAICWMNEMLSTKKEIWEHAKESWDEY